MAKIIFENNLPELAKVLAKKNKVYVPAKNHLESTFGQYSFCEISDEIMTSFDYPITNTPPKKFLLPSQDILFEFDSGKSKLMEIYPQIIFGVSYEDLDGIGRLTKVFAKPKKDAVFFNKRDLTTIIGIDRFSPPKDIDFDLYLQKINSEQYVGFAKTKKGQDILKSPLFRTQNINIPRVSKKKDELLSNPNLATIIEKSKGHPVWDELAEKCMGCGICSFVCPLCYCFDTEDQIDAAKEEPCGQRCRLWDSCMLKSFAETNAEDFRPELRDRIYNWYFHKFTRMPREYGFSGCVDCNRCVVFCPAKINYRTVLEKLIKD